MRRPTVGPHIGAVLVLLLMACSRPAPLSQRWHEGALAQVEARSLDLQPEARAQYQEGFLNGVKMVREAQERGLRPYLPLFSTEAETPRLRSQLPKEVAPLVPAPRLEVDPETGLEIRRVGATSSAAFARGQMDGFRWAWDQVRAGLAPRSAPEAPKGWMPWSTREPEVDLALGTMNVTVSWVADHLIWEVKNAGFPPQRRWREFPWGQPIQVSLSAEALWVVPPGQEALALDLDSGIIRAQIPAPPPPPVISSTEHLRRFGLDNLSPAEHAKRLVRLRHEAENGNTTAMMELVRVLRPGDEPGSMEEARARWNLKAAEHGDPQAMMDIAGRYLGGAGVPMDPNAARRWYQKAAEAGHPDAAAVLQDLSL